MNMVHLKKKNLLKRTIIKNMLKVIMVFSLFIFSFCEENDSDAGFNADFSYEFIDDNHVQFVNESEGEYYSLMWDFGNEQADTTTDKKKNYTIYYPVEGDYEVSLKLLNYSGKTEKVSK